jgi:hypothetical protein
MIINPAARDALAARQARRSGLRTNSAAICVMLLVQYGLGMGVNLYAQVPAADHGAGLAVAVGRALTSQPAVLATHTVLGLLMLVAGISVLVRAIRARHRRAIAASAAGLAAIIAAAFSGAAFVSNEQAGASMSMAVLTGVALLCYLANLVMVAPAAVSSPATATGTATAISPAADNSPADDNSTAAQVNPAAAIKE